MTEQPDTSSLPIPNKGYCFPGHLYLLITSIGLFVVGIMGHGYGLGNHMILKYTPLVDAAMEIKLEATAAHHWLEEILSDDRFDLLSL